MALSIARSFRKALRVRRDASQADSRASSTRDNASLACRKSRNDNAGSAMIARSNQSRISIENLWPARIAATSAASWSTGLSGSMCSAFSMR